MLLTALTLLLPAATAAPDRGVVAGLYGGGWRFDPTELLASTWTVVPRLGYQLSPRYAAEWELGYMQGLTRLDKSYTAWSPRLGLRYTPWPGWPLRPSVVLAPGAIYKDINRATSGADPGGLGVGGYVNPDLDLLLTAGPGLELPISRRLSIRGDLRFALDVGSEPSAGADDIYADWEGTLGLMFRPASSEPAPEPALAELPPEGDASPEEGLPSLEVDPEGAMIWIPHPICRWVPAGAGDAALAEAGAVRVSAPGYLPADVLLEGSTSVTLDPAPEQGSLVVLASPGDAVRLGEQVLPLNRDGTALVKAPRGPLTVSVTGGGRAVTREVLIASGYGLWLRIPEPEPLSLRFPVGGSTLDPASRRQLEALVASLGDYRLRVRGSSSPEGDPLANEALAEARAQAAGRALIEAGADPSRVVYDPPELPLDGDPAPLRSVTITPEPAGGAL